MLAGLIVIYACGAVWLGTLAVGSIGLQAALAAGVYPFVGADLSCVIVADCRPDNHAALMTTHSAALAGGGRLLAYRIKSGRLREMDLDLGHARDVARPGPAELAALERLKALIVTSTLLVDQNRVWSWSQFGAALDDGPRTASPSR